MAKTPEKEEEEEDEEEEICYEVPPNPMSINEPKPCRNTPASQRTKRNPLPTPPPDYYKEEISEYMAMQEVPRRK